MRFQFLGTAAAEAMPALWCECKTCQTARRTGGKNIRRRTAYLIDRDTLVDMGPDCNDQMNAFKIDMTLIDRVIFTHDHSDHLFPLEFAWRHAGFSKVSRELKIFGTDFIRKRILAVTELLCNMKDLQQMHLDFHTLTTGVETIDDEMHIFPMEATHDFGHDAQIFAIERGGKRILIANDTGWPCDDTWSQIESMQYDLAVIDSTSGFLYPDDKSCHMGIHSVVEFASRLREKGLMKGNGVNIYANHFSHNGDPIQACLEHYYHGFGIGVAYDGLVLDV